MKRLLMQQLLDWKTKSDRKPLILKGIRQSGKTYLLEQFGREQFSRFHLINFEREPRAHAIFEGALSPKHLLSELQFYLRTDIDLQHDLLIFDEIQACPKALTSLKYFCEEMPELAVCSAGSLLGLYLNDVSFPVGKVDMLHLSPMTFVEFLRGIGDEKAADIVAKFQFPNEISAFVHQQLWQRLLEYFITGGMPEVVLTFSKAKENLFGAVQSVRMKQKTLIDGYYADIAKHSGKVNAMHIDRVWRAVPMQLAQLYDGNTKRFRFKDIIPGIHRYSRLVHVIDWLNSAELILKVPIVDTVRQPLLGYAKENLFKLFLSDIGLLGAMIDLDPKTILDNDYGSYKGYFAENFVAQQIHTASNGKSIFNWQEARFEIEFLVEHDNDIIPIEVKSGSVTRLKSLQQFQRKYQPKKSVVFSADLPRIDKKTHRHYLPLYLAERIFDIVDGV
ncbi:MAG: ATP-binding protein [Gammaproteobacteria bacterium]